MEALDIEVALQHGWVRFWYKGELLLLPGDLQEQLDDTRRDLRLTRANLDDANARVRHAEQQARHTEQQAAQERQQKESLLAYLRQMGITPP